ncbi:AEC family transporter [Kineococcus sp. NUM-3379]
MDDLLRNASLAAPLFVLVLLGHTLGRRASWPAATWQVLSRFAFSVALPALLFRQMAGFSGLPPVDPRVLPVYFGGCLAVFAAGTVIARRVLHLPAQERPVFAVGGVFSNNVLLGLPLATAALGEPALPTVALVLVFHALVLWTVVTAAVEWARHRSASPRALAATVRSVLLNPVVAAIFGGTAFGLTGLSLPALVDDPLRMVGAGAVPLALVSLGGGLAGYGLRNGWRVAVGMSALKLAALPAAVWLLAVAVGLPALETQVVVLLASLSTGANVYLMATRFESLQGPVAAGIVLSTALSALTSPVVLTLVTA